MRSDASAPATARGFLADHGTGLSAEVRADAELLSSELISNAVLHEAPAISVWVLADPPGVGVAVHDHRPATPDSHPDRVDPISTSGRGLLIVDAVSDSWGIEASDPAPGKTVWFTAGHPR